jgi:hypothetical protein
MMPPFDLGLLPGLFPNREKWLALTSILAYPDPGPGMEDTRRKWLAGGFTRGAYTQQCYFEQLESGELERWEPDVARWLVDFFNEQTSDPPDPTPPEPWADPAPEPETLKRAFEALGGVPAALGLRIEKADERWEEMLPKLTNVGRVLEVVWRHHSCHRDVRTASVAKAAGALHRTGRLVPSCSTGDLPAPRTLAETHWPNLAPVAHLCCALNRLCGTGVAGSGPEAIEALERLYGDEIISSGPDATTGDTGLFLSWFSTTLDVDRVLTSAAAFLEFCRTFSPTHDEPDQMMLDRSRAWTFRPAPLEVVSEAPEPLPPDLVRALRTVKVKMPKSKGSASTRTNTAQKPD